MNACPTHAQIDEINEAQDRLIARKIRRDPSLVDIARRNLARWMARDGKEVRAVFQEWDRILTRLDAQEIARFLTSDNSHVPAVAAVNSLCGGADCRGASFDLLKT